MESSQTHKAFMCISPQVFLIHKPLISLGSVWNFQLVISFTSCNSSVHMHFLMCIWETQYHLPQDMSALAEDSNIMIF
jgi:hypothetical protein